jgi:hypothetical protein
MEQETAATDKVVRSILAKAGVLGAREFAAWKRPEEEIRRLAQRDYATCLRRHLSVGRIEELVRRARDVWPRFNYSLVGPPSLEFFSRTADSLQLHLRTSRYRSLALFGFYVDDQTATTLRKPLIFLNSAHHDLAIGSAFCHEVGHHFSRELVERKSVRLRFYFDALYREHLRDEGEIFADVVVSLAGYPKPAAEKIFKRRERSNKAGIPMNSIQRVRDHIRASYGFDFSTALTPGQNLQYLAGMVHYAKLREALLEEFGI